MINTSLAKTISITHLLVVCFISINLCAPVALAEEKKPVLDRPTEHLNTFFHTGIWVEDIDEMLAFLDIVMEYKLIIRAERRAGGERIILEDSRGQKLELLSAPGEVTPHPEIALHPVGKVAGVAHISIWVEDAVALQDKLEPMGYETLDRIPESYDDGYASFQDKEYRVLFVSGPGAMTFELFEVRD